MRTDDIRAIKSKPASTRESGFYWVSIAFYRSAPEWLIAKWDGAAWTVWDCVQPMTDADLAEIDERRILRESAHA